MFLGKTAKRRMSAENETISHTYAEKKRFNPYLLHKLFGANAFSLGLVIVFFSFLSFVNHHFDFDYLNFLFVLDHFFTDLFSSTSPRFFSIFLR